MNIKNIIEIKKQKKVTISSFNINIITVKLNIHYKK